MPRAPTYVSRVADWKMDLLAQGAPLSTAEKYEEVALWCWKNWAKEQEWPQDPRKITALHVREYMEFLTQWSSSTQLLRTEVLLLFLRWSGNKTLDRFKIKIRPERAHVDWLESLQVSMVLNTAPNTTTLALEALYVYTGIRRGVAQKIRMSDLDEHSLVVHRGKRGKGQTLPLTKQFWEAVAPYMEWRRTMPGEMFLLRQDPRQLGKPCSYKHLGYLLESHMESMGFHFSAHTFRRTFGRDLYFAGMPLPEISYLYGHKDLEMTIRYIGIRESDARSSLEKYQPRYI